MTPEELVTVATFESTVEASVARGALEAAGIPAFVPGETVGVFALSRSVPPGSWAELKVRPGDRERAVKVLKQAGHR
jgi:putative signal transducing protein